MAKRLQLRGGTTSQHAAFTGAIREVTVDTDKDTLVVHDGVTAGGFALAKATDTDLVNDTTPQLGGNLSLNSNDITGTGTINPTKAYIAETTLTDGATIDWDMATQSVAKVTLAGNRTLNAPTNGSTGQFASLLIIQDGTGTRTLTWNAVYEFATDTAPTLTATAGLADLFTFRYNGTKWIEVGRNLALTVA